MPELGRLARGCTVRNFYDLRHRGKLVFRSDKLSFSWFGCAKRSAPRRFGRLPCDADESV